MSSRERAAPRVGLAERWILLDLARTTLQAVRDTGEAARVGARFATLGRPGAAFVTLRRRDSGALRGCCGQVVPRTSLAQSVASMTLASAREDVRFPPVLSAEVDYLSIDITVLGPLERIQPEAVEVGRHGLVLQRGARRGLLLPQVATEQGWDRAGFLDGVCRKAGLAPGSWREPDAVLEAFEAVSWGDRA